MPTLRTQLRAILDKTDTKRQSDLMRLLLGLPAVRAVR
jgi:DNA-binding CsgD family transcriptional regulator